MKKFTEYLSEDSLNESMRVANTIKDQLGRQALAMMGAKNLVGGKDYLSFRIGRNSKGVNYVKITLTPMDLYDIEFGAIRGTNYKVKYEAKGVYADMMHKIIEDNTGMYLKLF
jgi:hypothetical protein